MLETFYLTHWLFSALYVAGIIYHKRRSISFITYFEVIYSSDVKKKSKKKSNPKQIYLKLCQILVQISFCERKIILDFNSFLFSFCSTPLNPFIFKVLSLCCVVPWQTKINCALRAVCCCCCLLVLFCFIFGVIIILVLSIKIAGFLVLGCCHFFIF